MNLRPFHAVSLAALGWADYVRAPALGPLPPITQLLRFLSRELGRPVREPHDVSLSGDAHLELQKRMSDFVRLYAPGRQQLMWSWWKQDRPFVDLRLPKSTALVYEP